MRRLACALACALSCALAGCSENAGQGTRPTGACAPPECALAPMMLAAEITPSPVDSSAFAPVELPIIALDPSGASFALELPRAVMLSGKVTIGQGVGARLLAGAVVASRPSRISGRPDRIFQAQIDPTSGEYALSVTPDLPGESYTLRVAASDASELPPQTFTGIDASSDTRFDLVLDDPATLLQLHGTVADPIGQPVPGLKVQAIDPASHAFLSTTATTDGSGAYAIRLARNLPSAITLVAAPGPEMSAPIGAPSLSMAVDVSKPGAGNSLTANLVEPPLPASIQLTYRVTGVGSSGAELPIAGALCRFSADVSDSASASGVTALFTTSATTSPDGQVTVALVPSAQGTRNYELVVAPPASSDFQRATFTLAVGQSSGVGAPVMLALRPEIIGRVLDSFGKPLPMASIQTGTATVAQLAAASLADVVSLASTTTGADGRFILSVDPGQYDLGIFPPAGSMLPLVWETGEEVQSNLDLGELTVPRGALVFAKVSSPDGQPRPGAQVQLYSLSPAAHCPSSEPSCLPTPRQAAAGTADGSGEAQLLLPAE